MKHSFKVFLAVIVACGTTLLDTADAHGYLKSPRSRNYHANVEAVWWGATDNDPMPESDPQSLNRGGTSAQCGVVNGRNYDLPKNALGGLMTPTVQECYNKGSIIDVKVFLTAHHNGHFEFYACPISWGEIPTERCFKEHPLEFEEDVLYKAPKDSNHPVRAYIPRQSTSGLGEFHYRYKLPAELTGELVLIQWYYITANTCTDEGYDKYPWPTGFGVDAGVPVCPLPMTGDGSEMPERFWNCAEVRITPDCNTYTTTSTTTPATACTPVPAERLPNGVSAVSQDSCNKCAEGYQWWPCNNDPPMCDCGLDTKNLSSTTTTTTSSATSATASQVTSSTTTASQASTITASTTTSVFSTISGCIAFTQEELDIKNEGAWATTNDQCAKCGPPSNYEWWPCNVSPALCKCGGGSGTTSTTAATTAASPSSSTTSSSTTTSSATTTAVSPSSSTASTSTTTSSISTTISGCIAFTQEELDIKNEGAWATTNDQCAKCGPPSNYEWWPCNVSPALCKCGGGSGTTSTTAATTAASPSSSTTSSSTTTSSATTTAVSPSSSTASTSTTTSSISTTISGCIAFTQEELDIKNEGAWATTNDQCAKCGPPSNYEWWPCNVSPALCKCGGGSGTTSTTAATTAASPSSSTTSSSTTTSSATTTAVSPSSSTASTSTTTSSISTTISGCIAFTQEELDIKNEGAWATTNDQCAKCGPPSNYEWWPCNVSPALCKCGGGSGTTSTTVATTTMSTSSTSTSTTGSALTPTAKPTPKPTYMPVTPTAPSTTSSTSTTSTSTSTTGSASMPTAKPTPKPTYMPVTPTPPSPPSPTASGYVEIVKVPSTTQKVYEILELVKGRIDSELFLYETPQGSWEQSSVYRYLGLKGGLEVMHEDGAGGSFVYLGDGSDIGHLIGLVNLATFTAQSMKETIKYDACDENSWDLINMKYPLSNACGQLGQSYQDYHCPENEKHMECAVDPNMSITAKTHAKWYGAPAPFHCGPKTQEKPFTGFWDYTYYCNNPWKNPPETCNVYEGQQAGRFDNSVSVANGAGRTDVEGCCWWGRGVIQTTGVCNFGKLNYYLGARAALEGRPSRYPEIDFCKDPEAICASEEHKELKFVAGLFYWLNSVQAYRERGWDYITELHKFVRNGMQDGDSFINAVSGIVNRGCHDPPCGTGPVDGLSERAANFKKVLSVFLSGSSGTGSSTTTSTIMATTTRNSATNSGCIAFTQEELNQSGGGYATSDAQCAQCGPSTNYQWWPCNSSPALCKCTTTPTTTTTPAVTTNTTTAATTATTASSLSTVSTSTTSSTSIVTPAPLLQHDKTIVAYFASWQWYDRAGLAKPINMDFTKVQRVNFAFFQTDKDGYLFGTDSWADPHCLFGTYNWNPPAGAKTYCSWDRVTVNAATGEKEVVKACNTHNYEEGLIYLVHAAGAEIYPSIGGWTLSDSFPEMAASEKARANFAANCVKLIQEYSFDGIDIDWEYPGYEEHAGTPNDAANFKLLLDEVRARLDELEVSTGKTFGLTAALPCGPSHISNMDIAHTASVLSELNLMTYDFHGAWDATTGINAPIYYQGWGDEEFNVQSCVQNWLAGGGTRDKLNIGLPFYGRSFSSASGLNQPHGGPDKIHWGADEGTPQYYNIVPKLGQMTQEWDDTTWTQWAYFNGGGLVSFDNEDAICAKTEFVQKHNLNGFIIWELSGDLMEDLSTPLLDTVNEKLLNPSMSCGGSGDVVTTPLFG